MKGKKKKTRHSYLDTPARSLDEVLKKFNWFPPLILLFFSFIKLVLHSDFLLAYGSFTLFLTTLQSLSKAP